MTRMARPLDDLGPDFELRWKQSSRGKKRELIAELRDLYVLLEDEELPLLAGQGASPARHPTRTTPPDPASAAQGRRIPAQPLAAPAPAAAHTAAVPAPPARHSPPPDTTQQGLLFGSSPAPAPRQDNPFLPKSVLERLHASQNQASAGLRELIQPAATGVAAAVTATSSQDLERELRLKLGPVIETLIDAHMDQLKSELRVRLRAEMDRLISDHLRQP